MKISKLLIIILCNLIFSIHAQEETSYWDNGNLRNVLNYKDGEKDGQNKGYYQNGQLKEIGDYKKGTKKGEWKEYYDTGQLKSISSYKNGDLHGERKDYHKNGKLSYIANYNKGSSIGESIEYDKNGNTQRIITYNNGEFYKSDNKERRLIEFETFSIDSLDRKKTEKNIANYLSRTDLIIKTEKNSNYYYAFGLKEKTFDNKLVKSLTILLLKDKKVVSEISYNIDFEFKSIFDTNRLKGFNIEGVTEALEIGFGREACGYGYHKALFFRKNNQLVKGVLISSFGEVESEYNTQETIAPLHQKANQVWVKNRTGHSTLLNNEYTEVNYFTEIEKYKYHEGKFVLINPKKDNFYYVTAKSGLRQRYRPFATSDTLSLLKYGTKVKLLNETNFKFQVSENGELLKGHWVQIEANDGFKNTYTSYVFDGYLTKELKEVALTDSPSKNGEWKWYYKGGALGELGYYKNGKKEGEWKWYYQTNGQLKATGKYRAGQPVSVRKWYHENGKLKQIGHYDNGKKVGEWKYFYYHGEIRKIIHYKDNLFIGDFRLYNPKGDIIYKTNFGTVGIDKHKDHYESEYNIIGEFKKEKRSGEWIAYNEYGQLSYKGHYKRGEKTGEWISYENGKLYRIAHYKANLKSGEWKHYRGEKEQLLYTEHYKKDKRTGVYKYYYDNGQLENTGYLENGLKTGEWKMYYDNGKLKNTRQYTNDKYNGKYIDYYKNEQIEEKGNYNNGIKDGIWISNYENGKLREATPYKNGKIHGVRSTYNEEGILEESIYIEHGDFSKLLETYFYKNGQVIAIGHTDNGRKYGIWKKFYEDGKLKEVNHYIDGKEDGDWKQYYKNGQLKAQGQHIKGDRDGKFIWYKEDGKIKRAKESKYNSPYVWGEWEYYDNGQLESVELYQRDELVEWKYYYDNGQLKEVRQYYKKRTRTGEWKYYYKNGQLRFLCHYKDEIPQGEFKLYHENGQLYKTQIWKYYKKLMKVNSCFDSKGNILDIGTLENGTGIAKEYNDKGELINIVKYKGGEKIEHSVSIDEVWNDSDKLNSFAWKEYEREEDKIKLTYAIRWVQRSIELDENYHNKDTYAALLYKIGRYKKALVIAEEAIVIAKKTNNRFKVTEELIEKINIKLKL